MGEPDAGEGLLSSLDPATAGDPGGLHGAASRALGRVRLGVPWVEGLQALVGAGPGPPLEGTLSTEPDRTAALFRWGAAIAGVPTSIGTLGGLVLAPDPLRPVILVVGIVLLGTTGGVALLGPSLLERWRHSRAVGSTPALVAFAILYLQITPTLEGAADFATGAVDGRLGCSLERHRRGSPTGRAAFEAFAEEWAAEAPSLRRAVSLVIAAVDTPQEERPGVLENALDAVLEGSRDRVARFASEIRGPATGIYAFGVMLPLALVGMLPVLSTTGGGVPVVLLACVYDLLLPVGLIGASLWLVLERPAVAGPGFTRSMLGRGRPPGYALSVGGVAGIGAALVATVVFPPWTRWIVGVGVGSGVTLRTALEPIRTHQDRIDEVESGLPDALAIAGRALADGSPVEGTIRTVADRLAGPTGEVFERADAIRSGLGTTVEAAFTGEPGALDEVPSSRTETAVDLLVIAGEHGSPAGPTLRSVGEYLDELQQVEREGRRDLARTTSTLNQTAMLFAPAIAGVTVGLATGMQGSGATSGSVDVAALGTVIGVYVLLLAVILPSLAVVLARGFDPVRVGHRSGLALGVTGVLYPLAFLGAEALVYF